MERGILTEFAAEQQRRFDLSTSPATRKVQGHFGTPASIAAFMAEMFSEPRSRSVRILDPGAGVGTLSAAVCQRVLSRRTRRHLCFELWESDPRLIPLLERTMRRCQQALRNTGHEMEFVVRMDDFILANARRALFQATSQPSFDFAILNPPYFKLRKDAPQARAMEHLVYGQPNIYVLFMAVAADLLAPRGELVAITPRSYFNGPYFKRFRKWFFDRMTVRCIHVFESRTEAFKSDSVLQENVILHAEKGGTPGDVLLTHSYGQGLSDLQRAARGYNTVVDDSNGDHVLRVTTNCFDQEIMAAMDRLPARFRHLDLQISTGPVVAFRATKLLRHARGPHTAPLLWMHNVRPFVTRFPSKCQKPTHIEVNDASQQLLVPARRYVLLKRFTAKEEKRRLVAGVFQPADSYSEWIGLENHLNYVYRRGAELSSPEAFGLAAFFNSAFVDRFFRAISGHTQVNATEIRNLPVPDALTLVRIGKQIESLEKKDARDVERVVGEALHLPDRLLKRLIEVAS